MRASVPPDAPKEYRAGSPTAIPWSGKSIALVLAHPDDETVGFGGQLATPLDAAFIYATDGAPRDMRDARARGFDDWRAYAEARSRELRAALPLTALPQIRIREIGIPDQQAVVEIHRLVNCLSTLFAHLAPDLILTHPFEGGHPDHDATAFAVHLAAGGLSHKPLLMEFTSYHLKDNRLVAGQFLGPRDEDLSIRLSPEAYDLKRRMVACFATQTSFLSQLLLRIERFRIAPHYDFTARPHNGPLFYETWESGMRWEQWLACIRPLCERCLTSPAFI